MTQQVNPDDWLTGPFGPAPVQVVSVRSLDGHDEVTVHGSDGHPSRSYVLAPADWEHGRRIVQADQSNIQFDGDSACFRLGIQAHRLRLAHSIDPYAALNARAHFGHRVGDHVLAGIRTPSTAMWGRIRMW